MPIILIKITEISPYSLSTTKRFVRTSHQKIKKLIYTNIASWQPSKPNAAAAKPNKWCCQMISVGNVANWQKLGIDKANWQNGE